MYNNNKNVARIRAGTHVRARAAAECWSLGDAKLKQKEGQGGCHGGTAVGGAIVCTKINLDAAQSCADMGASHRAGVGSIGSGWPDEGGESAR